MADESLIVRIRVEDQLQGQLKTLESKVIRFVGAVSSALSAIAIIGFPVKAAAEFEKELLNAARTTGYATEQINLLSAGLLALSTQLGVSGADLAKIAALGGQVGIGAGGNVAELVEFTKQIATASVALGVSVEEASTAFGKLIKIFNIPKNQFANALSALTDVGNASTATATELFDVARRIGDLGGAIDFPEAVALSGALIDLGFTAETAGTSLIKVFSSMRAKASEFATLIDKDFSGAELTIGSFTDLLTSGKGLQALSLYISKLNTLPANEATAISTALVGGGRIGSLISKLQQQQVRTNELSQEADNLQESINNRQLNQGKATAQEIANAQRKVDFLREQAEASNVLSRTLDVARKGFDAGTAAQRSQEIIMQGLIKQYDVFKAKLTETSIAIGNLLIPKIVAFLKALGDTLGGKQAIDTLRDAILDITHVVGIAQDAVSGLIKAFKEFFNIKGDAHLDIGAALKLGALFLLVQLLELSTRLLKGFTLSLLGMSQAGKNFAVTLGLVTAAEAKKDAETVRSISLTDKLANSYTNTAKAATDFTAAQLALNKANANFTLKHVPGSVAPPSKIFDAASVNALTSKIQERVEVLKLRVKEVGAELAQAIEFGAYKGFSRGESIAFGAQKGLSREESLRLLKRRQLLTAELQATKVQLQSAESTLGFTQEAQKKMEDSIANPIVRASVRTGSAWSSMLQYALRAGVGISAVISGLAKSFIFLRGVLLSFVNIAFLATIITQVLDLIGLLDPLKSLLAGTIEFFGVKAPKFLKTSSQTDDDKRRLEQELAKRQEAIDRVAKAASAYNEESKATVAQMSTMNSAISQLEGGTSTLADRQAIHTKAIEAATSGIASQVVSQNKLLKLYTDRALITERLKDAEGLFQNESKIALIKKQLDDVNKTILTEKENLSSAKTILDAYVNTLSAGLDEQQANSLFGSVDGVLPIVEQVTAAVDRVNDLREGLAAVDKEIEEGANGDKNRLDSLSTQAAQFSPLIKDAEENVKKLSTRLVDLGGNTKNVKDLAASLVKLGKEATPAIRELQSKLTSGATDAFLGKLMPKIEAAEFAVASMQLKINGALINTFTMLKKEADAAVQVSVNATATAFREFEKLNEKFQASMRETEKQRKLLEQEGVREKQARLDAPELTTEKKQIEIDRQAELDQNKIDNAKLLAQIEAFSGENSARSIERVADLNKDILKTETAINAKYDERIFQADTLAKKRTDAVLIGQTTSNIDTNIQKIAQLTSEYKKLDAVVANSENNSVERNDALKKQEQLLVQLKENIDEARQSTNTLNGLRVEDSFLVPKSTVDKYTKSINEAEQAQAKLILSGSNFTNEIKKAEAENAGRLLAAAEKAARNAKSVTEIFLAGKNPQAEFTKAAETIVRNGDLDTILDKVDLLRHANLTDSNNMEEYNTLLKKIGASSQQLNALQEKGGLAKLSEEDLVRVRILSKELQKLFLSGGVPIVETDVTAQITAESLEKARLDMTGALTDIPATVKVTKSDNSDKIDVGGVVGVVEAEPRARGGHISGPGSGLSDSILSWLSNGEYVIDAHTTRMFGSGFFSMLQNMARAGSSSNFLKGLGGLSIPTFAFGGEVSGISGAGAITKFLPKPQDNNNSIPGQDIVTLNVNLGKGRSSRLFGDRNAVTEFSRILKTIEKEVG